MDQSSGVVHDSSLKVIDVVRRVYNDVSVNQAHDARPFRRWRKRINYISTALLNIKVCRSWYHFLDTAPIQPILSRYPGLPLKPLKPYLSLALEIEQRVRVLQDSLLLFATHWEYFQQIINNENPIIAKLDLGQDGVAKICLELNSQKEGELSLVLRAANDQIAAMCSFAFERTSTGDYAMRIGRIQGVKDHDLLKRLEKIMHGLRPKSLMFFLAQELARALGVTKLFGVSNANQVYINKVLIPIPGLRRLSFNYDAFWLEVGGVSEPNGWFRLPLAMEKRNLSETKPAKRSMYKKRYAMLDDISKQVSLAVVDMYPSHSIEHRH